MVDTGVASPSPSCGLSSPSTSYTFSHVVHQPHTDNGAPLFLEQDTSSDDEEDSYLGKGKGKTVRVCSRSLLPSPPTKTCGQDRSGGATISLPSASPQAMPGPRHRVRLSSLQQPFSFMTTPPRILFLLITPFLSFYHHSVLAFPSRHH